MAVRVGDPIWVSVELRNTSPESKPIYSELAGGKTYTLYRADYQFTIVDPANARLVPRNPASSPLSTGPIEIAATVHQLAAETSTFVRFRLDTSYQFAKPGTYKVIVSSFVAYSEPHNLNVSLKSNPITIAITSRPNAHTAPAPTQTPTFQIRLQPDRPAYVLGQPIFLRLTMRNVTSEPIDRETGWAGEMASIIMLDGQGVPVDPPVRGANNGRGEMVGPFPPRTTLVLGYLSGDWVDLHQWGYDILSTGTYTLAAFSNYGGFSTSSPLRVRVLSKGAAKSEPSVALNDATLSRSIQSLLDWYHGVLVRTNDMIVQTPGTAHTKDIYFKFGSAWGDSDDAQKFQDRLKSLPIGNPNSPYANVTANLMESLRHLSKATGSAIEVVGADEAVCDETKALGEIKIAEYYYDAVRSEISDGRASLGDTATPPTVSSSARKCPW
jgi:hypothetical protein